MSGGSFDYLWLKEADDYIIIPERLSEMAETLYEIAPDSEAYRYALMLVSYLRAAKSAVKDATDRLRDSFQAVEYWRSGDRSREDALKTIANFRSTK